MRVAFTLDEFYFIFTALALSNVRPDWRYTRYFWAYYIFIAWIKCLKMNVENFNSCKRIISKLSWPTQCNVHGLEKWLRVSGTWKWSTDHNCDKLLFSYTFLVLLLTKLTYWFELLSSKIIWRMIMSLAISLVFHY